MLLAAVVLPLRGRERPDAAHVRGFFYGLLVKHAPNMHDENGLRPFAIGVGGRDSTFFLRLTFVSEPLYAALSPSLYALAGRKIQLGKETYAVQTVLQEDHRWAGLSSYKQLFQGEASADAPLHFVSPTFFRRSEQNYALPEPALVYHSLIDRWNSFAPLQVPDEIKSLLLTRLTLRYLDLRTRGAEAHTPTVGAVGRVVYHLPAATSEQKRWLTALTRYAFYAPVGAKTMLGFGQVRPYQVRLRAEQPTS